MASVVFDASAILALLRDEPGADFVARYVGDGVISAVNFQEVLKELLRRGIPIEPSLDLLDALHLDVRPHGRDDAVAAAAIRVFPTYVESVPARSPARPPTLYNGEGGRAGERAGTD